MRRVFQKAASHAGALLLALVLAAGGGLTWWAHGNVVSRQAQEERLIFERLADRVVGEVERRVNLPVVGLRGARGLYAASQSVTRDEFAAFVSSRDVAGEFTGALGLGYIERVRRGNLEAFVRDARKDGAPGFEVRNLGTGEDLFIVRYIYPLEPNLPAQGLDISSDPVRSEAAARAAASGEAALTGRISLAQDTAHRSGFVYLVPVYRNGMRTDSPETRAAALQGFVYCPLVIDGVFTGLMRAADGMLDVEAFDGREPSAETLVYDADAAPVFERRDGEGNPYGGRRQSRVDHLRIGGRDWTFLITSTAAFETAQASNAPFYTAARGALATVLLAGIVASLGLSRSRAVRMAHEMTETLRVAEAEARKLALVASRTSNAVILAGARGQVEWINESFTRLTGQTLEEVRGRQLEFVLQSADTSPQTKAAIKAGLAGGAGFRVEVRNSHKDGRTHWVDVEVQPLLDTGGSRTGMMAIQNEITERKAAEERIRAGELRLRELTSHAPGGLFQLEVPAEGRFALTFLSRGFQDLLGYDPAVFLRNPLRLAALILRDERKEVMERLRKAVRAGRDWSGVFRVRASGGKTRSVSAKSSRVDRADGARIWFGALTDITEQEEARRAAEAANVAKSQFLAMMSHEIRTPMNGVIGMTSLLMDTPLNPEQREFAEIIRNSGEGLLTLINDILDFSKIEAGHFDLEREVFSLRECVESALDLFALAAGRKGVDLLYEIEDGQPAELRGDVTRIRQILVNLLGNAVKFTEAGEIELRVGTVEEGGERLTHFSVRDTGIGIPEEGLTRLFRSFSQVDSTTSRKYGGTGLGLAISKRLAEMMGGRMWVESVPEEGSVFHFTVRAEWGAGPVRGGGAGGDGVGVEGAGPEGGGHALRRPGLPDLSGLRVLVVDDNATNRRILTHLVEKWGMTAVVVDGPEAALREFGGGGMEGRAGGGSGGDSMEGRGAGRGGPRFDLGILDMQMPGMNGVELARAIRAGTAGDFPLLLLTSVGHHFHAGERELFFAVLTKPAKPDHIFDAIGRVTGRSLGAGAGAAGFGAAASPGQGVGGGGGGSGAGVRPLRILLAEDNTINQKVAMHMLARIGYRVDLAANGLEAVDAFARQHYDVILMDMQMPEMDGLEACRAISVSCAGSSRALPWVIALTANSMQEDREACERAGMRDFLAKPIKSAELAAALERVVKEGT